MACAWKDSALDQTMPPLRLGRLCLHVVGRNCAADLMPAAVLVFGQDVGVRRGQLVPQDSLD